ncbi:dihydrofolate reductase [Dichotomocladium elegans]|nr:dihydrofolate reductase [Dichotomocladium elegans]
MAAAMADTWGIGKEQQLPWFIPADSEYLHQLITRRYHGAHIQDDSDWHNVVVMGRLSWEAKPLQMTPMPKCYNIIISRNPDYNCFQKHHYTNVGLATTIHEALRKATMLAEERQGRVFVMGGAQIYDQTMALCTHILLTRVYDEDGKKVQCDTFMAPVDPLLFEVMPHEMLEEFVGQTVPKGIQSHNGLKYEFLLYTRTKQ